MKFVDWCSDMIRTYWWTVYSLNFRMGCCTTVNYFTALHLLSVWDLIARYNIWMPTKRSCLNVITAGSNIWTVTLITLSNTEFRLFLYYSSAGLHRIRSSNFWSVSPPENPYPRSLRGARRPINGYYDLNLKNMRWWFLQSTKIRMVGLIVLMRSFGLSNRLIRCILYLSEQLFNLHIWSERIMLHQIESIAYGL
jgi:hypothetical protein